MNDILRSLVAYGIEKGLIDAFDLEYVINSFLRILNLDSYQEGQVQEKSLEELFDELKTYYASEGGAYFDSIRAALMDVMTLKPSQINEEFKHNYKRDPKIATDQFYRYCRDIDYIKSTKANVIWTHEGQHGNLQLTINLAKPEKDPKDIAKLLTVKSNSHYPMCPLCKENVGFYGNLTHAARSNLRVLPITLNNEEWLMQYSPYSYYNEHTIVFMKEHLPMYVDKRTFVRLFDFVDYLPHYFIGSNAGLPIVGGSILNHDHFQGGRHHFPMMSAKTMQTINVSESLNIDLLEWYMATIKLTCSDRSEAIEFMDFFFDYWKSYQNVELQIEPFTNEVPHQAITPVVVKESNQYHIYLTPRNNRTNEDFPDGIFHPHPSVHHIKKENIGLIEVLGCAILPGRLKEEMVLISDYLLNKSALDDKILKHEHWLEQLKTQYDFTQMTSQQFDQVIKHEIAVVFEQVLKDASVFKEDEKGQEAFKKMIIDCVQQYKKR